MRAGIVGVVGHEAPAEFAPRRRGSSPRRRARRRLRRGARRPAAGSRRPAGPAPRRHPRWSVPRGSSAPAIQVLRAVAGFDGVRNQVQRPPSAMRFERVLHPAVGDDHVRAAGGGDLGRLDLGAHAAARQLGGGAARHRLDLGRDALDHRNMPRVGIRSPAARCRGRRCRRAAPAGPRRPWWRRGPPAGRCRRSGSRSVATVSFSLTTGTAPSSQERQASWRGR